MIATHKNGTRRRGHPVKITVLPLQEALGKPLAHDLTQVDIARGTKGARF